MNRYIGTKAINAKPMSRQAYNDLRGSDSLAEDWMEV